MSLSVARANTGNGKTRNTASAGKTAKAKSSRRTTDASLTPTAPLAYDRFIDARLR